ncbi:MAG TPA: GNAT family N-acetyltransferase [Gaiellaceae bacterium]|nr:GNAT family N-acetyltransferase [Gaiellaceae bacterium]
MTIRRASDADLATLRVLWQELEDELGGPAFVRETWEEELVDTERRLREGVVLLAEEDGGPVGYAALDFGDRRIAWLVGIYVRPSARRRGVGRRLLAGVASAAREHGYAHLGLDVLTENRAARTLYERLGFVEFERSLAATLDELDARLEQVERPPSFGRVYAQTDDETGVERAVRQLVPRLGHSERTQLSAPRGGWIEVADELCSRDPRALRRLAQEISYRTGGVVLALGIEEETVVRYVLFDRGSVADEYASVPEFYGSLPPGDVVALGANPRVVQRLTGADPQRVRAVARTASSPDQLPPPRELYAELADVLGVGSPER